MQLHSITQAIKLCTIQTGAFIRNEYTTFNYLKAEIKGLNDLVSYVDKAAEQQLVTELDKILPEAGFITEENTKNELREYNWIIDPLDGTTNFIHGVPCYSVSVALQHQTEIIAGVVYEVTRDECFLAYKNGGAFLNDRPIHVSDRKTLSESLIATGFPIYNFHRMPQYLNALKLLMQQTHGIRRMGSAATDMCYVACGRFDAFFEYNLNSWDIAAGALIVTEAGGTVSDFNKGDNWLFGKEMIATNKHLQNEFGALISKSFNSEI